MPQCQASRRRAPSPPTFLPVSKHSTARQGVLPTSETLQPHTPRPQAHRLRGGRWRGWRPSTHAVRPIIRSNACSTRLTATAGTYFVRAWCPRRRVPAGLGSLQQGVVVLHAKWLGRAEAQCPKFFTAATRRCLSGFQSQCGQSPSRGWQGITGLVGSDPTNNLIPEKPIPLRQGLWIGRIPHGVLPPQGGRFFSLTHPYAMAPGEEAIQLACVKPFASVHSEPWLNSFCQHIDHTTRARPRPADETRAQEGARD